MDGPEGLEFESNFASLLQTTLDFGNSGKTKFDMDWYLKSLKLVFGDTEQDLETAVKFFNGVASKMSMKYKSMDIDEKNVSTLVRAAKKKEEDLSEPDKDLLYELYGATGNRRELIEYFVEKFGPYVAEMNNNVSLKYAVTTWNK